MHHKHHTEGLILGSSIYGETGKVFFILTRDLGLLYASATGIRKMSSRLRYVLHDFNYVKVDLIKGKDLWRITSASKTNELENITKRPETLRVFAHIAGLTRRLLPEQEKNTELFQEILNGLMVLERAQTKEEIANIEIVIVLRMLNNLGYIGDTESFGTLIKSPFEEELMLEISKNKLKAINEINKALRETQL